MSAVRKACSLTPLKIGITTLFLCLSSTYRHMGGFSASAAIECELRFVWDQLHCGRQSAISMQAGKGKISIIPFNTDLVCRLHRLYWEALCSVRLSNRGGSWQGRRGQPLAGGLWKSPLNTHTHTHTREHTRTRLDYQAKNDFMCIWRTLTLERS